MKYSMCLVLMLPLSGLFAQYQTNVQFHTPQYRMSAALRQAQAPGYLWFGSNQSGTPNFLMSGVQFNGLLNTTASYHLFYGQNCGSSLGQVNSCSGVSAVETNLLSGGRYAVAGAFDKGVFFAVLSSSGGVIADELFTFPPGRAKSVDRPLIAEETSTQEFYLCGNAGDDLYVMKVNAAGNLAWSTLIAGGTRIKPNAIACSSLSPNELFIVGETDLQQPPCGQQQTYPFFMKIDGLSGAVLIHKTYPGNCVALSAFHSLLPSASGRQQFLAGGVTKAPVVNTLPVICRLDASGNVLQSVSIAGGGPAGQVFGPVLGLAQRLNTFGTYEIYALSPGPDGMTVFKLDDNLNPWPQNSVTAPFNQFSYDYANSAVAEPVAITINEAPLVSGHLPGIQVYGNDANGWAAAVCVQAYFNGFTNCGATYTLIEGTSHAGMHAQPASYRVTNHLSRCQNFLIQSSWGNNTLNTPCQGLLNAGSNLRSAAGSEVPEPVAALPAINLYPNPASEKIYLHAASASADDVIELRNSLGQRIIRERIGTYGRGHDGAYEIDLQGSGIAPGLYSFTLYSGGGAQCRMLQVR